MIEECIHAAPRQGPPAPRNLNNDLQHQTYHEMLCRFMIFWYHSLFAFCCFIFGVVGFAVRGDPIKRLEYIPLPNSNSGNILWTQCFSMLQLIEHCDVKIFLILSLCDSIAAATFLSDPHPSNTSGSFQVWRTKPRDPIASDTRSLEPLRMLWEGSSASSTLSKMDSSDDVAKFPKAGGFPLARRVPNGRKESLK